MTQGDRELIERLEFLRCQPNSERSNDAVDDAMEHAADRLGYYMRRLEVVPDGNEGLDGIACRDETIKMQDDRIQALSAENEKLREVLGIRDATLARITAALGMAPVRNVAETEAAILADHKAGLSLRQIAAKQSVGIGIVRGIITRQALKGANNG